MKKNKQNNASTSYMSSIDIIVQHVSSKALATKVPYMKHSIDLTWRQKNRIYDK